MNFAAIQHRPKSEMSYALDGETLHLRIRVAKDDATALFVQAVDPFDWGLNPQNPSEYIFLKQRIREIPMVKEASTEYHDIWFACLEHFPLSRIRYGFVIQTQNNRFFYGCHYTAELTGEEEEKNNIFNYFNYPCLNQEDVYQAPAWVEETVWYQIFPDSFSREDGSCDDTHRGTLAGITQKLDYIQSMGFNGIYFTPIFQSPSSHRYDTTDYYSIDSRLGTEADFAELVEQAHKRGIRIMLDAVFNHCGMDHPFWQDVLKNGKDSPYYSCFYILDSAKEPNADIVCDGMPTKNYKQFGFVPQMPKWNSANPIVREHLIGAAVYWIEKYHIDGWRLDVSNEVSHDFWREFRQKVKAANPQIYILGENWDNSMPWLSGDQMDAVMNYEFLHPMWAFFGMGKLENGHRRQINARQFRFAMDGVLTSYPKPVTRVQFNLLESHDTDRLMTVCQNNVDTAALAYVMQMTFPGSPSVYYGGEIGMDGMENNNRQPMDWALAQKGHPLQAHIRRLIALRKENPCCKSGEIHWLMAEPDTGDVIYEKSYGQQRMYVLLHNHASKSEICLPDALKNRPMRNACMGEIITLDERIEMEPYSYLILV